MGHVDTKCELMATGHGYDKDSERKRIGNVVV